MLSRIENVLDSFKYKWIIVSVLFLPFIYHFSLPKDKMDSIPLLIIYGKYFIDEKIQYLVIISTLIICLLFFVLKHKPSKLLIIIFVQQIWTLLVTYINKPEYFSTAIMRMLYFVGIAMIVDLFCVKYPKDFFNGMLIDFGIFLFMNFITIILFRSTKGFNYQHYLLGFYNSMTVYAYPAIALSTISIYKYKKNILSIFVLILSLLTMLLSNAGTTLGAFIGSILCMIFLILINRTKYNFKHLTAYLILITFIFNIFILFIYSGDPNSLVTIFIEEVLHRDPTFTGRLIIWEAARNMIYKNPIIGYGLDTQIAIEGVFTYPEAHNMYLNILLCVGLIGFIIFIIFNFEVFKELEKIKNSTLKYIIISCIFGIFLTYITDAYGTCYLSNILFFLAYHLKNIIGSKINE